MTYKGSWYLLQSEFSFFISFNPNPLVNDSFVSTFCVFSFWENLLVLCVRWRHMSSPEDLSSSYAASAALMLCNYGFFCCMFLFHSCFLLLSLVSVETSRRPANNTDLILLFSTALCVCDFLCVWKSFFSTFSLTLADIYEGVKL